MSLVDRVWRFASSISGWQVIIADQNAPQPKTAFATVKVTMAKPFDNVEVRIGATEADGDFVRSLYLISINMDFYGPGAMDAAMAANGHLSTYTSINKATEERLSISRRISIQDFTSSVAIAQKEERAHVEFEMIAAIDTVDDLGSIQSVIIGGSYTGATATENAPDCEHVISAN